MSRISSQYSIIRVRNSDDVFVSPGTGTSKQVLAQVCGDNPALLDSELHTFTFSPSRTDEVASEIIQAAEDETLNFDNLDKEACLGALMIFMESWVNI